MTVLKQPTPLPEQQPLIADREQAAAFLAWLDPFATGFTFQTFDDTPEKRPTLARQFNGTIAQHAKTLEKLNQQGAGVFVTVNETDLKGRKEANVVRVRAVFADTDGAPLEPIEECNLALSGVVTSSPGKWHSYWLASGLPLNQFNPVQTAIAARFGTDPAVKDLPRVMRLPGFYHRKAEPFLVTFEQRGGKEIGPDEILEEFPQQESQAAGHFDMLNNDYGTENDFARIKRASLRNLSAWVPDLLPEARAYQQGYRVTSKRLGRNLEEDIGIQPSGIQDFGTERGLTPIDLVMEWLPTGNAEDATQWLADKLGINGLPKHEKTAPTADTAPSKPEEWPEVVDLFDSMKLPPFPVSVLPPAIADYAKDQGELIGVDSAVIGVAAIGAAAACIDDSIQIQPKRHDPTWTESARLWVGIIGDPSAKKSPGIGKAMGPLFKIDSEWRTQAAAERKRWEAACKNLEEGESPPPEPMDKRLIVSDATVEKMGDLLSKCDPRGILSWQDELSGWLASMDAYKNGGGKDRAAWLEAYNGGPKAIDRIARGSLYIKNWSACVVGGIQPSVVQQYATTTNHDGMLQRFVLVEAGEASMGVDRAPNMAAKEAYSRLMLHLSEVKPGSGPVTLSENAHKVREALDLKLHKATRSHHNKFLAAALGKWNGLFARLLLTFHCIEVAGVSHPTQTPVAGDTAQRVADLMWRVLLPHAVRFYSGLDAAEDHAKVLAGLMLARHWHRFTVRRDLHRNALAFRKLKPWEQDETLDRLESYGWIVPEPGKVNDKGRPSAYLVNPTVHSRFKEMADHEKGRRAEVAEMIREMKDG